MTHETDLLTDAAAPLLAVLPSVAWLPHKLVRKTNGVLDKPPCQGARTNDAKTWFTFAAASALLNGQIDVAGIGFAIVPGIVSLDFDHCRDQFTGELAPEVQREVENLNSYTYVTPSQTGIRVVGLNDAATPIPGGKSVRWLPGGHTVEIFVGPTNHYNTFTADVLPGYDVLRDISAETLDYLAGLDAGKRAANGTAATSTPSERAPNPDPQRSIAAIVAALACIPNTVQDWDAWSRIGMAAWRASGGRGAGLDAWMAWSAKHPCHDVGACEERWQHWFASPPTRIGFGTLYYEARKWKPLFVAPFDPPSGGEDGGDGNAAGNKLPFEKEREGRPRILSMRQLDALPPPEWLVEGLIPEASLVVPFGPPKAGKTFIVLSWCLHVAAGLPWFGRAVKQGAVVYIAGEGTGGLSVRLRAMRQAYGIDVDAPLFVVPRAVNFRLETAVADLVALVRATVGDMVVAAVVIDTLARAMPGADENSAQEVGLVIAGCDLVRDELACTVIPIHHSGKDLTRGARGTSALRGAWDTALEITGTGKRVVMTVVDQKEAEAGTRLIFRMDVISVGIGRSSLVPMLDEGGVSGVSNVDETPRPETTGLARVAFHVLQALIAGPDGGVLPPLTAAPGTRGVSHEMWRQTFYEKMPGETISRKRLAFWRASQKLEQIGLICMKEPWVWLI